MEDRKHFTVYFGQVFTIFGITLLVIAVICSVVGEEAQEYSTMFAMGSRAVPLDTVFQYLLSSACIVFLRFIFFSDIWLKKTGVAKRTVSMCASVIILIGVFAWLFGWFPVDDLKCWISFLVSFGICFAVSAVGSVWKERAENQRLACGLENLKEEYCGEADFNKSR